MNDDAFRDGVRVAFHLENLARDLRTLVDMVGQNTADVMVDSMLRSIAEERDQKGPAR